MPKSRNVGNIAVVLALQVLGCFHVATEFQLRSAAEMERGIRSRWGLVVAAQLVFALCLSASDLTPGTRISPFMECVPASPSASSSTQLELRGVVHEGKNIYLTFYEPASKQWFTLEPGQQNETASVESYDSTTQAAKVRLNGSSVLVAFKKSPQPGDAKRAIAYAASSSGPVIQPMPIIIPATSPAEAERLSTVAAELRRRQEQQKAAAADTSIRS